MGKKSKSNAKKKGKQARATKQASAPNASTQPTRQEGRTRPVPKLLRVGAPATGTTSSAGNATSVYDPHEYQNPYPSEVRKPVGWLRIPIKGAKQVLSNPERDACKKGGHLTLVARKPRTHT